MKKILILSYFYPPSNFAGSYRIKAWAEHLHKYGYYPIVVTRHWNDNETDYTAISDKNEITREDLNNYIVYRLPFKGSIRDRLLKVFGPKAKFIGKIFSFFQVIGQNYFLRSIPFRNLYEFSRQLLKEQPDIKILLTSGRPFVHFRLAHLLKNEFSDINWIADYRDPWNSCSNIEDSIKLKFLKWFEMPLEKKWIKNSALITTTSKGFKEGISKLIYKKEIFVINNGFETFFDCGKSSSKVFTVGYIGSLYPQQRIEVFLVGFRKFIESGIDIQIRLIFWGLGNNNAQAKRIRHCLKGYELFFEIHPWIAKDQLIAKACSSNVLLLCGISERKGTYTAKLFDYFSMRKPIVLCPSDGGELEKIITETNTGVMLEKEEDVTLWFKEVYEEWKTKGTIEYHGLEDNLIEYTYAKQVEKLADLLNNKIRTDI